MGSLLKDLHNLPSRGLLPAAGSVTVCSRAPNYVAAHSTEPGQRVTTDPTNPLVRTLKLRRTAGKKRKESPATGKGAAGGRGRKKAAGGSFQASANLRSYNKMELGLMSLKGLQDVLRAHGAPVSGRKALLVERIMELQEAAAEEGGCASGRGGSGGGGGGSAGGGSGSGAGAAGGEPIVLSDGGDDD